MKDPEPRIIITQDQSPTLFVPELNEHYHSVFGAVQESFHVFINAGLKQIPKTNISILEIGFGTGLNALLTFIQHKENNLHIYYETIEKYPLRFEIYSKLNYFEVYKDIFLQMHKANWNETVNIERNFNLLKVEEDLLDFNSGKKFDLIFFDAFAPDKQPLLWTEAVFKKMFNTLNPKGLLLTYSAKGTVKQALRNAGFKVERLPGPAGKRHMIRAVKET